MNIASIYHNSYSNGPGPHSVIHFQGCNFYCPGCFNKDLQISSPARQMEAGEIFHEIAGLSSRPSGVVLSGGEPFLQAKGLKALLEIFKINNFRTILYTGNSMDELKESYLLEIAFLADMLLCGRYTAGNETEIFPYTKCKDIYFFTNRYSLDDFKLIKRYEIKAGYNKVTFLGFPPENVVQDVRGIMGDDNE